MKLFFKLLTSRQTAFVVCLALLATSAWFSVITTFGDIKLDLSSYYKFLFLGLTFLARLAVLSLQYEKTKQAYLDMGISWFVGGTRVITGDLLRGIPELVKPSIFIVPFVITLVVHARAMWMIGGIWGLGLLVLPDLLFSYARNR